MQSIKHEGNAGTWYSELSVSRESSVDWERPLGQENVSNQYVFLLPAYSIKTHGFTLQRELDLSHQGGQSGISAPWSWV